MTAIARGTYDGRVSLSVYTPTGRAVDELSRIEAAQLRDTLTRILETKVQS